MLLLQHNYVKIRKTLKTLVGGLHHSFCWWSSRNGVKLLTNLLAHVFLKRLVKALGHYLKQKMVADAPDSTGITEDNSSRLKASIGSRVSNVSRGIVCTTSVLGQGIMTGLGVWGSSVTFGLIVGGVLGTVELAALAQLLAVSISLKVDQCFDVGIPSDSSGVPPPCQLDWLNVHKTWSLGILRWTLSLAEEKPSQM
eukprot:g24702.t1